MSVRKKNLRIALIFTSLISSDSEQFFTWLLIVWFSSFENCQFNLGMPWVCFCFCNKFEWVPSVSWKWYRYQKNLLQRFFFPNSKWVCDLDIKVCIINKSEKQGEKITQICGKKSLWSFFTKLVKLRLKSKPLSWVLKIIRGFETEMVQH